MFMKIDHIQVHVVILNKFQMTDVIQATFSDNLAVKLEITRGKKHI